MNRLTTSQIAEATGGVLRGAETGCHRVCTDSRTLQTGDLYVALRGDRFDGHQFSQAALDAGAAAVMVDARSAPVTGPAVVVEDTRLALGQLAAYWRKRMPARLIAITGSSGKTTVKDMLSAILSAAVGENQVWATQGNFNNDIGMPLTLLGLCPHHQFGVIEMGMNHAGELAYLVGLAQPEVVLINNAGSAHIGILGSPEAVARAKGEIILGAPAQAIVVLNADDRYTQLWRDFAGQRQVVAFSIREDSGKTAQVHAVACLLYEDRSDIKIRLFDTELAICLPVPGRHNVMNALAALAAAQVLGISIHAMRTGLEGFHAPKGRLQFKTGKHGTRLFDDTYNANPESMRAAIDVLASSPGIRILVMGDMGELGEAGVTAHADIGRYAKACHVDSLYALGEASQAAVTQFGASAQHFNDADALVQALSAHLGDNVTLLVKGSRFMHMERVVEQLEEVI